MRLGFRRTRRLYAALVIGAFLAVGLAAIAHPTALLGLAALPLAWKPFRLVTDEEAVGADLLPALAQTGLLQLGYAVALTVGLILA